MTYRFRLLVAPALLVALGACTMGGPAQPTAADYARAMAPTIRPGEAFKLPSEHHLTLSGDYTLPGGCYRVDFVCAGEVDYRIDDQSGKRNGRCVTTGVSNSATEPGVVGPGLLGIAIVSGTIDVKLK